MKKVQNVLLSGALILFTGNVLLRLLDFAYRVMTGRLLTVHDFGLLNLALPIQFMIVIFTSGGVAPSVAKFIAEARTGKGNTSEIYSSTVYYFGIIGVAGGLFFALISPLLAKYVFHLPELAPILILASISVPVAIIIAVFTGTFQGFKRMTYMSSTLVAGQLLRVLLALALIGLGWRAFGAMLGSTTGFIIAIPIAYFLFQKLPVHYVKPNYTAFKKILKFSIPASISALAIFILAYTDTIFLGIMRTPAEVGIYAAASPTSRLFVGFAIALYATVLPLVSESIAKKDKKAAAKYLNDSLKYLAIFTVPVFGVMYYFAELIFVTLFGNAYVTAVEPFRVLLLAAAGMSFYVVISGAFQGQGRPRIPMYIIFTAAVMNIILNAILIPSSGVMGAATASAASATFAAVSMIVLWQLRT